MEFRLQASYCLEMNFDEAEISSISITNLKACLSYERCENNSARKETRLSNYRKYDYKISWAVIKSLLSIDQQIRDLQMRKRDEFRLF